MTGTVFTVAEGAVAAPAGAAAFVFEGAYQSPHCKAHGYRHNCQCYDCLYHGYINRLPIWKKRVDTIQAKPMVYATVKSAHFHLPLSFLMATMVETQGM